MTAEYTSRLKHIISHMSSWKGRCLVFLFVLAMDLLLFSMGAIHRLSLVSLRSFRALFLNKTGSIRTSECKIPRGSYDSSPCCSSRKGGTGWLTVGLGHEQSQCHPETEAPDDQHVLGPAPVGVRIDEAADERADGGADEGRDGEDGHGPVHPSRGEQVADRAARHGQEAAAEEALEEASVDHGLDVPCLGRRDSPDEEEGQRTEVDGSSAIEFAQRRPERPHGDAQDEGRQSQRRHQRRAAKLGVHLLVGDCVDGTGAGTNAFQRTVSELLPALVRLEVLL